MILLVLGFLLLGPIAAGVAAGVIVDAWLNLRDLRRTGHVSACSYRWSCTC